MAVSASAGSHAITSTSARTATVALTRSSVGSMDGRDWGDGYRITAATVELLQTLIRNRCVNDGTPGSGRSAQRRRAPAGGRADRVSRRRWEPVPGSGVVRRPHRGSRPDGAEPVPDGSHRRRARQRRAAGDARPVRRGADPQRRRLRRGVGPGRRRHAQPHGVDGRRLPRPRRGFRPRGDLSSSPSPTRRRGARTAPAGWPSTIRDAIRCDYVLTESGGLHDGRADAPVVGITVAEKGVAWRRLASAARRATARCRSARQRAGQGGGGRPASGRVPAGAAFHELWPARVESLGLPDELKAALLDPARIDAVLDELPNAAAAAHLHACTHTTFSPNLVDGGVMKANVIPDDVAIDVDIRTMPASPPTRSRPTCGPRSATSPTTWRSRCSSTTRPRSAGSTRRCGTRCSGR